MKGARRRGAGLVLVVVLAALAPGLAAQPSAERPSYSIGDTWPLADATYRLARIEKDVYVFTLEPQHPVDFEMANHYVSTYPESRFVLTLTAQRPTPVVRYGLRNREFVEERGAAVQTRTIDNDDEILTMLADVFGLRFPAGTRFRALQGG